MKRKTKKQAPRIRRSAADARGLIVEKALELFATGGFYETSFQMIADACEMSQTAVLYHFKSKTELLKAVLHVILLRNSEVVEKLLTKETHPMERLRAHFEGNLRWALKYNHEAKNILLIYYFGSYVKEFSDLYQLVRTAAAAKIEMLLKEILSGQGRSTNEAKPLSLLAHDLLLGSIVNCASVGGTPKAQAQCRESWELFFSESIPK